MAGAVRSAVWIWVCVAAGGLATRPVTAQRPASLPPITVPAARIDSLVSSRMTSRRIPGVAVGIVANGRTVFQKAYGVSNLETETPLTLTSVFELASVTKQFTAAAIMMLVEAGKVRLDDSIATYIDGAPAGWSAITVRHLLTHTSGIVGPSVPDFQGSPLLRITTKQAFDGVASRPPLFPAGENALYSDQGYFLLGMIIEKASGMRYGEFLRQRIFAPLQMTHSSLLDKRRVLKGRVSTYEIEGDSIVNWRRDWQHELPSFFGVFSTVEDLVRWDEGLRHATLLKDASLEQMWTPAKLRDGRVALVTGRPYGFGFEISDLRGHRVVAHSGASGTYVLHFMDEPLTIIVLTNLSNTAGPNATLLAREVAGVLRPDYLPPHYLTAQDDPSPALTTSVHELLTQMGAGHISSLMTAQHAAWYDATPAGFRSNWFRRLSSIGPLTYQGCDNVQNRGIVLGDPIGRLCYYRGQSGEQTLFITAWFSAEGKVAAIRFGRSDEL